MNEQTSCCQRTFCAIVIAGILISCIAMIFLVKNFPLDLMKSKFNPTEASSLPTPMDVLEHSETGQQERNAKLAEQTLQALKMAEISQNDPLELVNRFKKNHPKPEPLMEPAVEFENGQVKKFWILDVDQDDYRQVDAVLVFQTPHLYYWVEQGVEYEFKEVVQLADVFENQIYPLNRAVFGSEWRPGVDNDDHLVIVYAHQLGGAAGYFSSSDSLLPEVKPYSNAAEMFYLSADYTVLNSSFTYGVLAHEFQHMIHWNQDRNESSWLNEAFSELAVDLNGFDIGGFDYLFAQNPDLQLNYWPDDEQGESAPHYGASYLFAKYLHDQFGQSTITEITQHPKKGLASLDEILQNKYQYAEKAGISTADQVFQNWTIANLLQNPNLENGIYGYGQNTKLPVFRSTERISCGSDWQERTVSQYGTDYLDIDCASSCLVEIEGTDVVQLLPANPYSGDFAVWSNSGEESHMRLWQEFDFTNLKSPIQMSYWTWFDIEENYDYVYLTATRDGKLWQILEPETCTYDNPTGANYGCGYSGRSEGWIQEVVDLSDFAGEKVTLQFEYITDAAINGEGFLLDDISLDAMRYFADFEHGSDGWQMDGFVRVSNYLPQAFSVAYLQQDNQLKVEKNISTSGLSLSIPVQIENRNQSITLVISGLTRFTHQSAVYRVRVDAVE